MVWILGMRQMWKVEISGEISSGSRHSLRTSADRQAHVQGDGAGSSSEALALLLHLCPQTVMHPRVACCPAWVICSSTPLPRDRNESLSTSSRLHWRPLDCRHQIPGSGTAWARCAGWSGSPAVVASWIEISSKSESPRNRSCDPLSQLLCGQTSQARKALWGHILQTFVLLFII